MDDSLGLNRDYDNTKKNELADCGIRLHITRVLPGCYQFPFQIQLFLAALSQL